MDLYCSRCGEPWELDYVMHDMAPEEKEAFLKGEYCPSCKGKEIEKRPLRAELAGALQDILGDDIDGIAAEMEDADYMFGSEFWE
jgi:hypothetical protein